MGSIQKGLLANPYPSLPNVARKDIQDLMRVSQRFPRSESKGDPNEDVARRLVQEMAERSVFQSFRSGTAVHAQQGTAGDAFEQGAARGMVAL